MKTSKLKQTLIKEARALKPSCDVLSKIKLDLGIETITTRKIFNKKVSLVFASAITFAIIAIVAISLIVSGVGYEGDITDTYLSIDINPSIEFNINGDSNVTSIRPMNEDAAAMLYDVELVGLNVDLAIDKVIEVAIEAGYLDPLVADNAIKFVVINGNFDKEKAMNDKVKNKLNESLSNRGVSCQVLEKFSNASQAEAKAQRVSVGKMELIKAVREIDKNYKVSELKDMSVSELNEIILSYNPTLIQEAENEIENIIGEEQIEVTEKLNIRADVENRYLEIQVSAQNNPTSTSAVLALMADFNIKYPSWAFTSQNQGNPSMLYSQIDIHMGEVLTSIDEDIERAEESYDCEKKEAKKNFASSHGKGKKGN